jgi:hypothetical protein
MKISVGRIHPHLIRDFRVISGHEMRQHESFDASGVRNSTGILGGSLMGEDAAAARAPVSADAARWIYSAIRTESL